jgi:hypothetical protein
MRDQNDQKVESFCHGVVYQWHEILPVESLVMLLHPDPDPSSGLSPGVIVDPVSPSVAPSVAPFPV